jgi:formylglycine-generating enzyme required for sulfatase activity
MLTVVGGVLGAFFVVFQFHPLAEPFFWPILVITAIIGIIAWMQTHPMQPAEQQQGEQQQRRPPPASPQPKRDRAGAEYRWVPAGAGLAGFWMMRTPVTNALWRAAVEAGVVEPPSWTGDYNKDSYAQHPVMSVTREQVRTYAAWVAGRLPRDAEWTRAAQGDDGRKWPWGNTPPDATRANCRPHGPGDTTPVGAYPAGASPYGLLDVAGNVWEWVDDGDYVVRGGAFDTDADDVMCGARLKGDYVNDLYVGFRVVSPGP